jgi:uncharacterized membrane protein
MDWRHLHLALNHVPVVGIPLLVLLSGWGFWRRSEELVRVGLWWLLGMCAVSVAIKFTGDFSVENGGETWAALKEHVDRHEQSADQATTVVFLTGIAAGVALWLGRFGRRMPTGAIWVVLVMGVATTLLMARTANLGGRIVHPFLRPGLTVERQAAGP